VDLEADGWFVVRHGASIQEVLAFGLPAESLRQSIRERLE
jgi:hypothetical protein